MMPQAGGMHVYLLPFPSQSLIPFVGLSLWLDILLCHRDRDDRRGGGGLCTIFWCTVAVDFGRQITDCSPPPLKPLCAVTLNCSVACDWRHRVTDVQQYSGAPLRETDSECIYHSQDGALGGLLVLGILLGRNASALHANFSSPWHARGIDSLGGGLTAATMSGLLIAICLSQTGSLFSADSWHNIAFAAAEVKNPERNVTLAMVIGATVVIVLYVLANIAYLVTLPLEAI